MDKRLARLNTTNPYDRYSMSLNFMSTNDASHPLEGCNIIVLVWTTNTVRMTTKAIFTILRGHNGHPILCSGVMNQLEEKIMYVTSNKR